MYKEVKLTPIPETIQFINMSDEEYFSEKWSGYVSNSKLSLINPDQGGSPEIFREGLSQHPKYSDSLVFGSAVHQLALQPDEFTLVTKVNRPTSKMGAMADELYSTFVRKREVSDKEIIAASDKISYYKGKMDASRLQNVREKCAEYWHAREEWEKSSPNKTPIYLDPKSREKLLTCLESFKQHKGIQAILHPTGLFEDPLSINEGALFMEVKAEHNDAVIYLKLKAKLDNFTINTENNEVVLNDLKTTGHWLIDFGESFKKFHYNRQMAMYSWMLRLYVQQEYGMKPSSQTANMLLVSTVPDYRSGIFKVSSGEIRRGFLEFKDLLQRVAYLVMYGNVSDGIL